MSGTIRIIPVEGFPLIQENEDIANLIIHALDSMGMNALDGDIMVIAHTIVSKAEGRFVQAEDVNPSKTANDIAEQNGFDPKQVELALEESKAVLRKERALITEMKNGHICNFSGVDHSNAPVDSYILLPNNPDTSAERIRAQLEKASGKHIAVVISDTEGRPWRKGSVNIAIGCAGVNAFKHNKGKKDLFGRTLQMSLVCQIDQIASAAGLVMGEADEGVPVVLVRGYEFEIGRETVRDIHRNPEESLFR